MPDSWSREYRGIGVKYSERVVRIANDEHLDAFFREKGRKGALALSEHILKRHAQSNDKPLRISVRSLAAEIYDHYKLQVWTFRIEKIFGKIQPTRWMIRHMDVIDCGDREVDNNRFLWDLFSIFW